MSINFNRTKVVCTIGPACNSDEVLREMIKSGMDVARLNFSHGSHEVHAEVVKRVRRLSKEMETPVMVLQDLQGPKIRIGILEEPYPVKPGDRIFLNTVITEQKGNILPIQYETFARDVRVDDLLLADDGKVNMKVIATDKKEQVEMEIIYGKSIGSRKGVNLPFTNITMPSLTEKDIEDLEFGLANKVDWVALSFVRTAQEVRDLKRRIKELGSSALVISKIEKPEALKNIDEIIQESDGIMVARGDLGVEIPLEEVPIWQKKIIRKSNLAAKPVIVATQMMESMMDSMRPTRAEANDVANAVTDGADAVMLSGETSVGKYPVQTVKSMNKILEIVEEGMEEIYYPNENMKIDVGSPTYIHDSIIVSACKLSKHTRATAIVGMTASGYTAFRISKCRPKAHIFIFTHDRRILNVLNLVWGVRAFYYDSYESTDKTIEDTTEILKLKQLIGRDDVLIHCASTPLQKRQRTNMVKISIVE